MGLKKPIDLCAKLDEWELTGFTESIALVLFTNQLSNLINLLPVT